MADKLVDAVIANTKNKNITVTNARHHLKASESYIDVKFQYAGFIWDGSIPYQYRRTGLFLDDPKLIAELLEVAYKDNLPDHSRVWVNQEKSWWEKENAGKAVTKGFFYPLLNLEWNCVQHDFPPNPNWARRIQDIKEMGYTLATDTKHICKHDGKASTHILLLPFERSAPTGYEFISPKLRERVIKLLGSYDAYDSTKRPSRYLIPDHKFPEISWDSETKKENLDDLSDQDILAKFQLLDNQRNLQKREACRTVFQTGDRGTIFGIRFYYEGTSQWPEHIPKVGKASEKGWVGSPWYDIERWRRELNKKLDAVRELEKQLGHPIEDELKKRLG